MSPAKKVSFDTCKEAAAGIVFRNVRLSYPHLQVPDTHFDDDGVYRAGLVLSEEEAESYMEQLQEVLDNFVGLAAKDLGKKPKIKGFSHKIDDDGNVTFNVKLQAKKKNSNGDLVAQRPVIVDAAKNPMPEDSRIGGGTLANVSVSLWPYHSASLGAGITMRIKAVQILDLKQWGGEAADAFSTEDGFTSPSAAADSNESSDGDF